MNLVEIKGIATKFATTISKILNVDVMIVDKNYNWIANTFTDINLVTSYSIIGSVMQSGKVAIVNDKKQFDICKNCPDVESCVINGFIGVPIFYDNKVIGVISLLILRNNKSKVFDNLDVSVDFLERMSDLLSSKLKNIDNNKKLNIINKEREIIIDMIDDALVFVNNVGEVIYYNNKFEKYFEIDKKIIKKDIRHILEHSIIKQIIELRKEISYKMFYYEMRNIRFYGFLSYRNIIINGVDYGGLFTFKSARSVSSTLNKTIDNKTKITFGDILDKDPFMIQLMDTIKHLAVNDESLLINGKKGLGKSILARAIHNFSDRSKQYFALIDCDNIPSNLLENEIFGNSTIGLNESPCIGKIRVADKGTVYFRNISEMPMNIQKRLVEVMKTREIKQSSYNGFSVNTRMIFDTTEDLYPLAKKGLFNEELYYRITKNVITIPSLVERREDIKVIVNYMIKKYQKKYLKQDVTLSEEVVNKMVLYHWPNNIKEIEKTIELIIYNAKKNLISLEDVYHYDFISNKVERVITLEELEKETIQRMLTRYENKDHIAELLGIGRATLYRKLNKYRLNG